MAVGAQETLHLLGDVCVCVGGVSVNSTLGDCRGPGIVTLGNWGPWKFYSALGNCGHLGFSTLGDCGSSGISTLVGCELKETACYDCGGPGILS